jgi:TonB family protein
VTRTEALPLERDATAATPGWRGSRAPEPRRRSAAAWVPVALSIMLHAAALATVLGLLDGALLDAPAVEQGVQVVWQDTAEESLATGEETGGPPPPPAVAAPPDVPPSEGTAAIPPPPVVPQPPPPEPPAEPSATTANTAPPAPPSPPSAEASPEMVEPPPPAAAAPLAVPEPEVAEEAPKRPEEEPRLLALTRPPPLPAAPPVQTAPADALPLPPAPMPPPPPGRTAAPAPATPPQPSPPTPQQRPPAPSASSWGPGPDPVVLGGARAAGAVAPPGLRPDCRNPEPVYPRLSRERGEQGVVGVLIRVSGTGQVQAVEVTSTSGFPALDDSARRTVERWTCLRGAMRDGQPVPGTLRTYIHFRLSAARP